MDELDKYTKRSKSQSMQEEEEIDIFGNTISTPCIGSDGSIYDIDSMIYLFEKNDNDDYKHIPYVYDQHGERIPKFPIMGNGKPLRDFEIIV